MDAGCLKLSSPYTFQENDLEYQFSIAKEKKKIAENIRYDSYNWPVLLPYCNNDYKNRKCKQDCLRRGGNK